MREFSAGFARGHGENKFTRRHRSWNDVGSIDFQIPAFPSALLSPVDRIPSRKRSCFYFALGIWIFRYAGPTVWRRSPGLALSLRSTSGSVALLFLCFLLISLLYLLLLLLLLLILRFISFPVSLSVSVFSLCLGDFALIAFFFVPALSFSICLSFTVSRSLAEPHGFSLSSTLHRFSRPGVTAARATAPSRYSSFSPARHGTR